jgi:hypothetical protein
VRQLGEWEAALMKTHGFGETKVERCVESDGSSFYSGFIFPDYDPDAFEAERRD